MDDLRERNRRLSILTLQPQTVMASRHHSGDSTFHNPCFSREAAQDHSPRRKPWVNNKIGEASPEGAQENQCKSGRTSHQFNPGDLTPVTRPLNTKTPAPPETAPPRPPHCGPHLLRSGPLIVLPPTPQSVKFAPAL